MSWILLILGVLNVLEGIKVLVQKLPAAFLKYELDYLSHGIFHLLVGAFLLYIHAHESLLTNLYFRYFIGGLGLLAITYSFVIFGKKQPAEKFGRTIKYPIHASYYFSTGLILLWMIY